MSELHPLQNAWTMWYDSKQKRVSQQNWGDDIKKLHSFHTVEDFWRLYNNIVTPSKLGFGSNYHLFKEDIAPNWDDATNAEGGRWILTIPKHLRSEMDEFWLRLLLSLIGEKLEEGDDICGCVVSVRARQDKIAVWTRLNTKDKAKVLQIGQEMRKVLELSDEIKLSYQVHDDAKRKGGPESVLDV